MKFFEMKGKEGLGDKLLQKMEEKYPKLYEKLKNEAAQKETKKSFWHKVGADTASSNFSFNFGN